jgi:predicted cupin superfamily sugar epimerase
VAVTAEELIQRLSLQPHPEGGYFRETFRDEASTSIYFLLLRGERSHWHRVTHAVEIWHFHLGAELELLISPDGRSTERQVLGQSCPQRVVPRGAWQSARSLGDFTLCGCTVAPPFAFEKFELAPKGWCP